LEFLTLTLAGTIDNLGGYSAKLIIVGNGECVLGVRVVSDAVQFVDVNATSNANGNHSDVVKTGIVGLLLGLGRVGAPSVGDDDADSWGVGTCSTVEREHLLAHVFDGVGGVSSSSHVVHALNAGNDVWAIGVHIQRKLQRRIVTELHHAYVDTAWGDVQLVYDS